MTRILLVDDDSDFSSAMQSLIAAEGHQVETAATVSEAKALSARTPFDLQFVDLSLPDGSGLDLVSDKGPSTVIITGHPSVRSAIKAVRGPVIDYLVKPVDREQLLACIESAEPAEKTTTGAGNEVEGTTIIGESDSMLRVLAEVSDFGPTDEAILILGESGTGKDLIAHRIHEVRNPGAPFIPLNCGAIPKELIASELFGHEKGSFTGAAGQRKGVFERAGAGTVFLDEVGELPLEHQVAMLRVLENRTIVRVGGEQEITIKARVIAATNRKLDQSVSEGAFREDLFFRLSVLPINVPPLRERHGDIERLARHFLEQYADVHDSPTTMEPGVLDALNRYHWPGNVRELKHTMLRMAILNRGKDTIASVPESFEKPMDWSSGEAELHPGMSIKEVEKTLIEKTLEHFDGNKSQTAESLGISLKTLYNRLTEYGHKD